MIWFDWVIIVMLFIVTPFKLVEMVKEGQKTGKITKLWGAMLGAFMNYYIVWRIWP